MMNNFEMNVEPEGVIVVVDAVYVEPEFILPVTIAEILDADFGNDDEAEFLQAVLEIQQNIESVLLSDNPEDFLLPTADDLPPALILLEKIEQLKSYAFGDRTLARMERRVRGINEVVRTKLTETEKASHPDYRKCHKCLRHFTKRYLGFHIDTPICVKVASAHNLRPTDKKTKVSDKIYNACLDMEDLYARSILYKKNIGPELEEEEIDDESDEEEENNKVWVIKTYEYNHTTKTIDYAGLWDNGSPQYKKEFDNEEEARGWFVAITAEGGQDLYIAIELIEIDPTSEDRETIIDRWEENIDDYIDICKNCYLRFYDILFNNKEKYGDWCHCLEK